MNDVLVSLVVWIQGLGSWGPVLLALAYVIATVLVVPGIILTLAAGFLFGPVKGTITVSLASTAGAAAAFLVGRTLARGWVERKISAFPKFKAIDEAVGRDGFKIVLLTRLSPVFPFSLLNYAFSMTKVPFGSYVLASWIGMIPGAAMYVTMGSALKSVTEIAAGRVAGGTGQHVLFGVGLVATVLVTTVITRVAKRALNEAVA